RPTTVATASQVPKASASRRRAGGRVIRGPRASETMKLSEPRRSAASSELISVAKHSRSDSPPPDGLLDGLLDGFVTGLLAGPLAGSSPVADPLPRLAAALASAAQRRAGHGHRLLDHVVVGRPLA